MAGTTRPPLVILDCDGVLVDSEPVSNRVLTQAINEVGVPMSLEEVRLAFKGESLRRIATEVSARLDSPLPADWLEDFQRTRAAAFEDGLEPIPGVAAAIDGLRTQGLDLCVASQAGVEKMELTLGLTGLAEVLDGTPLFSASMVARAKPAPDLFLHAADRCGHPPSACVVVEDGVLGVRAARSAGMRVLGFGGAGDGRELAAAGAELFERMDELERRVLSGGLGSSGSSPAGGLSTLDP